MKALTIRKTVTKMADGTAEKISFDLLADELPKNSDTVILMHRNPDGDAVGTAFALRELLRQFGCRAWCVCEGEIPSRLQFLTSTVQSSVLLSSVPFDWKNAYVIAVDIASPSQLGALRETFENATDLMIDHHSTGIPFAKKCYVDGDAAATAEILFDLVEILIKNGLAVFTPDMKKLIYAGISSDTGCFRYSNVTPQTHLRASKLVGHGIDTADINHKLFDSKSFGQIKAEAFGAERMQIFHGGRVSVIAIDYSERVKLGLEDNQMETLIDIARSLAGVEVAITVRQPNDTGSYRVSTRSAGTYDVAKLCAKFGGGGHEKAAGCTITAESIDEAVKTVVDAIEF